MCVRALLVGFAFLICGPVIAADDAAIRGRVSGFLESSWEMGDAAKSAADASFAHIEEIAGVDTRAFYAHALVMMYQRRYDEAFQSLDQVLKVDDQHFPAWRAKIWLALLTKNYGVAITAMGRLGELAAAAPPDNKEAADDAARFLGAVFGFLAGPIGEIPSVASRESVEEDVLAALSEEQKTTFTEARQTVIEKFTELTTERADTRESKIADEEAEKQKTLDDIAKRRESMAAEADDLKQRRDKLQGELRDELAEIAKEDRPLLTDLTRLQSRAVAVAREHDSIVLDIDRLEARLVVEKDPAIRAEIRRDIDRLSILARRYDVDLDAFARQIGAVQSQRVELAARQAQAQRNLGGQIQTIDRRFNALNTEERRLAGAERKARKASTGSSGKVNALGVTAAALKTYEPFPLEQERRRLLESLR